MPDNGQGRGETALGVIVEVELCSEGVLAPEVGGDELVYVLLRWKGRPVGRLILEGDRLPGESSLRRMALEAAAPGILMVEIEKAPGGSVLAALGGSAESAGKRHPQSADVSVIIATRDRPEDLSDCLEALRGLDPPPGEIVVVDSASGEAAGAATVAGRWNARLIRLEQPGLSRARNAGALAATGRILAFLDDDCRVDPGWLLDLCAGFTDDGVEVVTGQLLPREIETEAQRLFLRYSHMDLRGFIPRRYERGVSPSPHWPIDAWRMGSGGNLAVRADVLRRLGGFRLSLGLGTPARGGEDLFLLWSIVRGGGAVVYRPGAMAWHRHHRTEEALRRVLFGYGAGHAAYLRAIRAAGAARRPVALYRLSFYADRLSRWARSIAGLSPVPASLVLREVAGSLAGGRLGRKAEWQAAR